MSQNNPAPRGASFGQVVKFTLFSASAGILQVASFALLSSVFFLPYWLSYAVALILSVLWNFTFNRRYTFRSDANLPRSMALVALFYLVFTPASAWWGTALQHAGRNAYLIEGMNMLINFVTEFLYQKFVVYRGQIDTNDLAKKRAAD